MEDHGHRMMRLRRRWRRARRRHARRCRPGHRCLYHHDVVTFGELLAQNLAAVARADGRLPSGYTFEIDKTPLRTGETT